MSAPVVVLTGGVGGAKLVAGLYDLLPPDTVTAIVNTGDDFEHLGLHVSPDIDTLLYTLSGRANVAQGWGREGETWSFMAALRSLSGPDWFNLGDGDVALHVFRTQLLRAGVPLSQVVAEIAAAWRIAARVLPMSDDSVRTLIDSDAGRLAFQDYFVAWRAEPVVTDIVFDGASQARPADGVVEAILDPATRAVLIAPSNPFLSVDPIIAIPAIREALLATPAPVVAVSPLVGGEAVKGPTAKLMRELGIAVDVGAIAAHYGKIIDALLVDERDPPATLPIASARADTLMTDAADRRRVAEAVLVLADAVR